MGKLAKLARDRKASHKEDKRIIRDGLHTYVEVGLALKRIKESRSFELDGYEDFIVFLNAEFQLEKSQGYRLADTARVYECISPIGGMLPANERVARELTRLEDKDIDPVWAECVGRAPVSSNGKVLVTAKFVKSVVKEYLHDAGDPVPFPGDQYRVLYVDPPWLYSDKQEHTGAGAEAHYPCMSIDQLCNMADKDGREVKDVAASDAVLFMWATSPMLDVAFEIIGAWEFKYKASFIWDKVRHNFGNYNSVRHELLLICTRGSCIPTKDESNHDSVVEYERTERHSKKPAHFRELIDKMYPVPEGWPDDTNDRLEIFAREPASELWDVWGNQL